MKNFYYTLLFLGFSLLVSAQDLGGTPVEGLITIKKISTTKETTVNNDTKTNKTIVAAKTTEVTTTPSATGTSQEVGITEGQLSVSLSGGASYAIPIAVPPGINGVLPQVSLVYNSQGGNGVAGYGWNISGVSAITRIPRTKFHDGVIGGVNLDANDRFALDGQRLIVKNNGVYGANNTEYETENFSNIKITSVGVSSMGTSYGPASFKVEYPDGSKAEYGASNDSRSITTWGITYWETPQGVRISYNYLLTNNNMSIEYIKYGSISTNTPINQIKFVYSPRKRPEQSYVAGQSILMNTILKEIKTIGNGIGFRNYVLEPEETSLGYERLKSITEKSGDGTKSYNPTMFSYDNTPETISYAGNLTSLSIGNINFSNAATVSGDFDGDEKMDFLLYPTTGTSSKSKYWIFSEFTSNNLNIGYEHNVGAFETIFPVSWLTWNNKLWTKQGWAVAKKADTSYTFTVYCAGTVSPIYYQYEKVVNFPLVYIDTDNGNNGNTCYPSIPSGNYMFPKKILSGDFNGDGLTDVIAIDTEITYNTVCQIPPYDELEYQNGIINSKKVYFIDLKRDNTSNFLTYSGELLVNLSSSTKIEVADVNGDGKSDFMVFENGKVTSYTLNNSNQLVLLWYYPDANISIDVNKTILLGDYNGDGKMDFIVPKGFGNNFAKYTSTGISFIKEDVTYDIPYNANYGNECPGVFHIIPNDFDEDGKTDLILVKNVSCPNTSGQGVISVRNYKNTGTNFVSNMFATTELLSEIGPYAIPVFLNSDKLNVKLEINFISNNKIFNFQSQKDFSKEKLLKTIITGNGVTESITYQPLSPDSLNDNYESIYSPALFTENYPQTDIESATNVQVVTKLEKQSASVYKKQLYAYAGATTNFEGLGFLGFRASMRTNWFEVDSQIISSISKFDPNLRGANVASYTYLGLTAPAVAVNTATANVPRTSAITIDNTRTATETVLATNSVRFLPGATISPLAGNTFVAKITPDYDANGFAETNTIPPSNLISKSLSFYEASLSASKVYKLQNTQSNTYNILENTSSETNTVYDIYNNPTESISKIRNGGAGEQTTISMVTYQSPTTSPYAMGRPISKIQTVTSSGDNMTSKETYGYGSGTESNLLKNIQKWGNNTNAITEDNIYDTFGNITKKTITVSGLAARETNYEYNPAYPYNGRFLTQSTDVEGLTTQFDYNTNNGLLVSENNPYNLTTTYLYNDPWFKKTETIDYLGNSNTYVYTRSENVKTKITTTGDDGSYSEELFDDLGRKITSGVKDISGNTSKVSYLYDIYDRNIKVSEPYFGTGATQWNETQYDEYGRKSQKISFTGKTVSVSYSGLTTTVNDGTKTKTSIKNAIGNVVSMTDTPGGTINYTYFANGNLKSTNYNGVVTTIEQDGWGRKTKLTDLSAGTYTYAYNGFGETTSETTPNGTTTYTLNAVGKLTAKTISGTNTNSSTVYNYNSTTKLLDSSIFTNTLEAGAVTTNTYSYDSYKRLVSTTEVTPYATFSKTINIFDAFGRVETETTSGTTNGKTSSKTIKNTYKNSYAWQILDNVSQQVLWQTNTVNARGQLLTADLGNGIAITNSYDTYGFATQFKHDKTSTGVNIMTLGTTFDPQKGNLSTRTNSLFGTTDNFTYDTLDRLTSYPDALGNTVTQSYKEDGRIEANTLGTYNYTNTAKKYQNTSVTITPDALTYYQAKPLQTITYNTFKSPVEIKEQGIDIINFTYNDNNDRSTMFYGSTNPDKNLRPNRKYYSADGSMEIKQNISTGVTEFITYIGGDGYSAPIVLKSDGTTQNYLYLHRDYQGSILAITDANAAVLEKRLFDAWGSLISVQNGAGVSLNGLTILDRGYTGHEHLQSVGLINMNGRIYDPKLHRFLQPDNFVQDPNNTQSYNRYGYCWNNPLKYADYNGEWFGWDDLIVAAASFVIGYVSSGISTGNWGWKSVQAGLMSAVTGWIAYNTLGASTFSDSCVSGNAGMWNFIGSSAASAAVSYFMPPMGIQIGNFSFSVSPAIAFGNTMGIGANLSVTYSNGDFSFSGGIGIMSNSNYNGLGKSGMEIRKSILMAYDNGKTGFSLGTNIWSGTDGMEEFSQRTGVLGFHSGDFRFTYENDGAPFGKSGIGDGNDRYRTAAVRMSVGEFSAGFNLFTGSRTKDSYSGDAQYVGKDCVGNYGERMPNDLVVETGTRYRMGAAYIGYGNYRFGINSDRYVRHPIQDHFAHNWIGEKQPGFESLSNSILPYFQYQTRNPFTSW